MVIGCFIQRGIIPSKFTSSSSSSDKLSTITGVIYAVKTGFMEISLSNTLLDNISRLNLLSSCPAVKAEPFRKFYQDIEGVLKLLRPVIDATGDLEAESSGQISKALAEVNAIVNKAIYHLQAWHHLSSKVCFVSLTRLLLKKIISFSWQMELHLETEVE